MEISHDIKIKDDKLGGVKEEKIKVEVELKNKSVEKEHTKSKEEKKHKDEDKSKKKKKEKEEKRKFSYLFQEKGSKVKKGKVGPLIYFTREGNG